MVPRSPGTEHLPTVAANTSSGWTRMIFLARDKIARQMELVERNPNDRILLSGAYGLFRYRYYRAKFVPTELWQDMSPADWLVCKLSHNVFMQTATWLVSRALTEAA